MAINKLVKEISLETYDRNTIIFYEHDASNQKAYIILEGSVGIWKENKTKVFEEDFQKLKDMKQRKTRRTEHRSKTLHTRNNSKDTQKTREMLAGFMEK